MLAPLRTAWRELKDAPPGRRFQHRFRKRAAQRRGALAKCAAIAIGIAVILVGVIALPLPGPGLVIIALGALLIAEQSRSVARALDRLELRLRRRFASWRFRPRRSGIP